MSIFDFMSLLLSIFFYIKSKNIIVTLINFFTIMYYLQVNLVYIIFNTQFSKAQNKFDDFSPIFISIFIFTIIISFINYNIDTNFNLNHSFYYFRRSDIIAFFVITIIAVYLLISKGVRIDGSFVESKGIRSVFEDYMVLPIIVILFKSKARWPIVLSIFIMSASYFLAGERMRMFIYLASLFFIFTKKQNTVYFKASLFGILSFAELISIMRSGGQFIANEGYKITHFGSVTISSAYLLDYIRDIEILGKFKYFLGIILGNFIPSSLLMDGFDIRRDLVNYATIPGGGWLPVWLFSVVGYVGLIVLSVLIAFLIRFLSLKVQRYKCRLKICYLVFFVVLCATLPRWYMYTPYQLIRFPLYAALMCYFINFISYVQRRSQNY